MIKSDNLLVKSNSFLGNPAKKEQSTRNGFESDDSLTFNPGYQNRYKEESSSMETFSWVIVPQSSWAI